MNVKQYRISLFVAAILIIIVCIFAVYYAVNQKKPAAPSTQGSEYQYMLKEHDEQIGVYRTGEVMPFKMLDVYTFNLPVADQYELVEGIFVQDDKKLQTIIEDYES